MGPVLRACKARVNPGSAVLATALHGFTEQGPLPVASSYGLTVLQTQIKSLSEGIVVICGSPFFLRSRLDASSSLAEAPSSRQRVS